ncbi:hypothetical protein E4191_22865 (plasmid) [Paracoccus liaowanqingii]|uniref:Uncharacterized protein n=1 Tax=Paracoccus liaowanqingii TaxID=2560053 RepID=A0A4Y5SVS5_9RHOB|nr:hypothetical protein [Paracoccus liaowanqingii]QDA36896.1 hypothetical protein E4191_22865 [Paracoccus liaowanqingii]
MNRMIWAGFAIAACCSAASAQEAEPDLSQPDNSTVMAEATWDWQPGDLIFRNDVNDVFRRAKLTPLAG